MPFEYVCSEPNCTNTPVNMMRDGSLWCGQHPTFTAVSRGEAKPVAKHNHSWSAIRSATLSHATMYYRMCMVCGTQKIIEEHERMAAFEEIITRLRERTELNADEIAELRRKINELAQPYVQAMRPIDVAIASARRAAQRWVALMVTPDDMLKAQALLTKLDTGWFPASQAVIEAHSEEMLSVQ